MELLDFRSGEMIEVGEVVRQDDDGNYYVAKQVCDLIEAAETWKKNVDSAYKDYKAKLRAAMEDTGIYTIDAKAFIASYKDGYYKSGGVDARKLEDKYPEVFKDVKKKETWVNPTVSVRLRSAKK